MNYTQDEIALAEGLWLKQIQPLDDQARENKISSFENIAPFKNAMAYVREFVLPNNGANIKIPMSPWQGFTASEADMAFMIAQSICINSTKPTSDQVTLWQNNNAKAYALAEKLFKENGTWMSAFKASPLKKEYVLLNNGSRKFQRDFDSLSESRKFALSMCYLVKKNFPNDYNEFRTSQRFRPQALNVDDESMIIAFDYNVTPPSLSELKALFSKGNTYSILNPQYFTRELIIDENVGGVHYYLQGFTLEFRKWLAESFLEANKLMEGKYLVYISPNLNTAKVDETIALKFQKNIIYRYHISNIYNNHVLSTRSDSNKKFIDELHTKTGNIYFDRPKWLKQMNLDYFQTTFMKNNQLIEQMNNDSMMKEVYDLAYDYIKSYVLTGLHAEPRKPMMINEISWYSMVYYARKNKFPYIEDYINDCKTSGKYLFDESSVMSPIITNGGKWEFLDFNRYIKFEKDVDSGVLTPVPCSFLRSSSNVYMTDKNYNHNDMSRIFSSVMRNYFINHKKLVGTQINASFVMGNVFKCLEQEIFNVERLKELKFFIDNDSFKFQSQNLGDYYVGLRNPLDELRENEISSRFYYVGFHSDDVFRYIIAPSVIAKQFSVQTSMSSEARLTRAKVIKERKLESKWWALKDIPTNGLSHYTIPLIKDEMAKSLVYAKDMIDNDEPIWELDAVLNYVLGNELVKNPKVPTMPDKYNTDKDLLTADGLFEFLERANQFRVNKGELENSPNDMFAYFLYNFGEQLAIPFWLVRFTYYAYLLENCYNCSYYAYTGQSHSYVAPISDDFDKDVKALYDNGNSLISWTPISPLPTTIYGRPNYITSQSFYSYDADMNITTIDEHIITKPSKSYSTGFSYSYKNKKPIIETYVPKRSYFHNSAFMQKQNASMQTSYESLTNNWENLSYYGEVLKKIDALFPSMSFEKVEHEMEGRLEFLEDLGDRINAIEGHTLEMMTELKLKQISVMEQTGSENPPLDVKHADILQAKSGGLGTKKQEGFHFTEDMAKKKEEEVREQYKGLGNDGKHAYQYKVIPMYVLEKEEVFVEDGMGGFFKKVFRSVTRFVKRAVKAVFKVAGAIFKTIGSAVEAGVKFARETFYKALSPVMKAVNRHILKPIAKVIDKTLGPIIPLNLERKLDLVMEHSMSALAGRITMGDFFKMAGRELVDTIAMPFKVVENTYNKILKPAWDFIAEPIKEQLEMAWKLAVDTVKATLASSKALLKGDFKTFFKEAGRALVKGMSTIMATSPGLFITEKITEELLRNEWFRKIDGYFGGLAQSSVNLMKIDDKISRDEKIDIMATVMDAVKIAMAVMSGGTAVAIMGATNATMDITGLDQTSAGLIVKAGIAAYTGNYQEAGIAAVKEAAIREGSKLALKEVGLDKNEHFNSLVNVGASLVGASDMADVLNKEIKNVAIIESTQAVSKVTGLSPELASLAVSSVNSSIKKGTTFDVDTNKLTENLVNEATGLAKTKTVEFVADEIGLKNKALTSLVAGGVSNSLDDNDQSTMEYLSKNQNKILTGAAVEVALRSPIGQSQLGSNIIHSSSIALLSDGDWQKAVTSEVIKHGKDKANAYLAEKVGHGVTVDDIIKYGSKIQMADATKLLKEIKLPTFGDGESSGMNFDFDLDFGIDSFKMPDLSLDEIDFSVSEIKVPEIKNPFNQKLLDKIMKEVERTPENLSKLADKTVAEIARTPENIAKMASKVGDGIEDGVKKLGEEAQEAWKKFTEANHLKYGGKLAEFLLNKYGPRRNYDMYVMPEDLILYKEWTPTPDAQKRLKKGNLGLLVAAGLVGATIYTVS